MSKLSLIILFFFWPIDAKVMNTGELVPSQASKISHKNGHFYLSKDKQRKEIFVNCDELINCDITRQPMDEEFHCLNIKKYDFETITAQKTNKTRDVLFVGTKSGLLTRLVYMEGCVAGKPRYFKDVIAENVGGRITKIRVKSPSEVKVSYRRHLRRCTATYIFNLTQWQKKQKSLLN